MDILGYELTGTLEAVAVTVAVLVEALVLYVAYEGATRVASNLYENLRNDAADGDAR